ncbi:MAG: hypothetical protein KDK70_14275 [Myxococcales bacterium]|nr:hypothetical protein [Myxococcales bacterium]
MTKKTDKLDKTDKPKPDAFGTGSDTQTRSQDSPQQGRRDIGGYVPTT